MPACERKCETKPTQERRDQVRTITFKQIGDTVLKFTEAFEGITGRHGQIALGSERERAATRAVLTERSDP
jgi:hypothetical protein